MRVPKSSRVVVIGAGSAGCTFALQLADAGVNVDIYTKEATPFEDPESSSSFLLAGGYAAVPFEGGIPLPGDSIETHVQDTLGVGGGLNSEKAVRYLIDKFPHVINWLENRGITFDADLHSEGSHSASRVYHVSDRTGQTVMGRLGELVFDHPNITVHPKHMAVDLITANKVTGRPDSLDTCLGAYFLDTESNEIKSVAASAVVVATGGLGKVFRYTTNPDTASGDGFAMCYRIGLPLVNMEFVQFHPTVYYDPSARREHERRVLFTEALRGAGAILKLAPEAAEDFVLQYDPRGSRASRDVVTRAEDMEMRRRGLDHIWLDCTEIEPAHLRTGFQAFSEFCLAKGIDPTRESVPVVYAAHYSNGGVLVGLNGETVYPDETGVKRLYVVGETAYTGLHGATRLASNSGPEAIAMSLDGAEHFLRTYRGRVEETAIPPWNPGDAKVSQQRQRVEEYWDAIRSIMTKKCGMAREEKTLKKALDEIEGYGTRLRSYYWDFLVEKDFLEDRSIYHISLVILQSALFRNESRTCHFRSDYPETRQEYRGWTVIRQGKPPELMPVWD